MVIHNMIQGSDEWHEIRKRKLTGSHATAIGNNGKGLITYIDDIIEALIFESEFKGSKDTERGHELEPFARLAYEFHTGNRVKEVGFVEHCPFSGISPDGLIPELKKGLEIKARNNKKHLALLRYGKVDSSTIWQMNMGMLVTGYETWDFVSYNPNCKQSIFLKVFERDEAKIEKLRIGLENGISLLKAALEEDVIKTELNAG